MMRLNSIFFILLMVSTAFARIDNPRIFVGEIVLGATAGAPLITDANGKVASGILNAEVNATGAITTTSTTDVLMTGMTTTPVAGTYLVIFSTWCSHSAANDTITISLYNGSTQKADSVRQIIPFTGGLGPSTQNIPAATQGIVTMNGTNAIQVEWHTNAGTATCTQRTLDIVRLL